MYKFIVYEFILTFLLLKLLPNKHEIIWKSGFCTITSKKYMTYSLVTMLWGGKKDNLNRLNLGYQVSNLPSTSTFHQVKKKIRKQAKRRSGMKVIQNQFLEF